MNPRYARLVAILSGLLLTRLAASGMVELSPEAASELRRVIEGTLELLLVGADGWLRQLRALRPRLRRGKPDPTDGSRAATPATPSPTSPAPRK